MFAISDRNTSAKRLVLGFLLATSCGIGACKRTEQENVAQLMNRGKAYLENREGKKAIGTLRRAVRLEPDSPEALRNLARAYRLTNQQAEALAVLQRASLAEADSTATEYLTALTLTRMSRLDEALPHFSRAVHLDPETAALRYQLANAFQAVGDYDNAGEQLLETVRLDPLHASAHYRLSNHARKAGDTVGFQHHQREFVRLRQLFGDQTRSTEALETCTYTKPEPAPAKTKKAVSPTVEPVEVRFSDVTEAVFLGDAERAAAAAAILDVSESGETTIFVVDAEGRPALLRWGSDGVFTRSAVEPTAAVPGSFSSCATGDFHNDVPPGEKYNPKLHALNDVVLAGPAGLRLLKRYGADGFHDATQSAGLLGVAADRARWIDYDHDGDLDLIVATTSGASMWQNNGNGRFQDVTADAGLTETGTVLDVVAVDLDSNVAVDIVLARGTEPTLVFENQRAGRFRRMPEPAGPWPAARRVLADDLNNDGRVDVVLMSNAEVIVLFGKAPARAKIRFADLDEAGVALVDYDNDGLIDLCVFGRQSGTTDKGSVRLFRNGGDHSWHDVTEATGLTSVDLPPVSDVVPVDFDADGDSDLLVITATDGLHVLRNDGGHINGQLKIRLSTIKTNPTGIGAHVELRDRRWWITRTVTGPLLEIGLGGRTTLDSIQTVWTNGVVENIVDAVVPPQTLTIVEKNVAIGSCPFLYAWDGHAFRFVTDLLGNSPIGLPLHRNVLLPADPDEIVRIGPAEQFPPREGVYTTVITDEFREVLYLDQAKLMAVDHRPDVEIHSTDKLMPAPFPPSELWAITNPTPLVRAFGDDRIDRTEAVSKLDGVFSLPGRPLPSPYRGMCHPLALTLDFGALDASRPWVLALTGWLQYGDASTNIAMSQNTELTIIPPTLEAESSDGSWREIDITVGMPAGKTKTILCDLAGRLPSGVRRLRLTTTFEIRWDRIALFQRAPLSPADVHELPPYSADLAWRGFSEIEQRSPGHPTTPDFNTVSEFPPWRTTLAGWCTRYGDVTELTVDRDDRLVLVNGGDALTLRFEAGGLPPVPNGMVRTFFFYSVGWDKDGDYNVVDGDVVGPLPSNGETTRQARPDDPDDWRIRYNTRWVPFDRFTRKQ